VTPSLAAVAQAGYRILIDATSIMLAAGPYIVAGTLVATLIARVARRGGAIAALIAAFAPGCDCSMNGFATALRGCPVPLAGAALTWGAVCNPFALAATAAVLGHHLLYARIVGGLFAAAVVAASWSLKSSDQVAPPHVHACAAQDTSLQDHLERALRLLLPAACCASLALAVVPHGGDALHSPFIAAIAGAVLSPCSSADPMLAKLFTQSQPSQAAFMIAAQCLDLRQLALLQRHFGNARTLLACLSGAAGCVAAAALA
jgi:uncharacterized membrane protein YraQ (UPF0718 family)